MAINLATLTPASTKAKNVATEEYVDTSTDAFATSIYYPDTTEIDGGKIRTNTINADRIIAGTSMSAPLISGGTINGGTINGGVINGAVISGVVIKASYLDLDGELEVLTNYHITVAMYNANPALYTDAVYMSSSYEYRIPSISTIVDSDYILNYPIGGLPQTLTSVLSTYETANVGNNNKAVKLRPYLVVTDTHRLMLLGSGDSSITTTGTLYFGETKALTVTVIGAGASVTVFNHSLGSNIRVYDAITTVVYGVTFHVTNNINMYGWPTSVISIVAGQYNTTIDFIGGPLYTLTSSASGPYSNQGSQVILERTSKITINNMV